MARRFDWFWVLAGVALMVGGQVGAYRLLRPVLDGLLADPERVLQGAALMAGGGFLSYFLGGLLVGRMSSGHTVTEPAVAGVLAMVVIFGLQLTVGMVNIVGLVLGAPFCFGLAYFGGVVGERWQRWSRSRRARSST